MRVFELIAFFAPRLFLSLIYASSFPCSRPKYQAKEKEKMKALLSSLGMEDRFNVQ